MPEGCLQNDTKLKAPGVRGLLLFNNALITSFFFCTHRKQNLNA